MGTVAIAIPIDTFQLASNRVGLAVHRDRGWRKARRSEP